MIEVIYKGNKYNYNKGISILDIANNFNNDFKYPIIGCKVNGINMSMNSTIDEDCNIEFFDLSSTIGNKIYERSAILILSKAIKDLYNKKVRVEHSIDKGIYCITEGITSEDIPKIKEKMIEIVNKSIPIEKINTSRLKMINYYKSIGELDKSCLLKYISNSYITTYKLENTYDYMYGEMVVNTSYIKDFNLEYVNENGFVLMLPFTYDDNIINEYNHHEKFFNAIMDYVDWTSKIGIKNFCDINSKISSGHWDDLVFMSEASYNKSLLDIADTIYSKKDVKMVLISGPSCSGKTTTSKKIEMFLKGKGLKPIALSVDDYFLEREETPMDEFGKRNYESVEALDINLFNTQLKDLIDGKEVLIPTFNFVTGKKEYKKKLKLDKDTILIIEGLHSLNDKLTSSIDNSKKYKIYISPLTGINLDNHNRLNTTDNRLLRRIVRDNLRRGYSASESLESWGRVRAGETKYVFPYQDEADIVLNTSLIYEMSVLKVYAEPLLFSVEETDPYYGEAIRLINLLRMILPMPSVGIPLDSIMREFIGNSCFDE